MPRFEESGRIAPPQHSEAELKVLRECRPHRARIQRFRWPPTQRRPNEDKPTLAVTCIKCGATVLAEVPVPKNLEVVLYGPAEDPAGTVVEEGLVLEAEPVETERGGTVSEEPDQAARGSRGRLRA